ncbi:hypothetical protein [Amycolatopsis sp. NPDC059021]|uniref:PspA-associated protein PspAB n=1 Tax=Amycolatopsis sp. NPDC059021 TaxID=3346704 RepID=UPI003671E56F
MTLLSTVRSRRMLRAHLQALDAVPAAAVRLRAALGLVPAGRGTISFVPRDAAERTQAEIIAATAGDAFLHNVVTQDVRGRSTVRCWRRDGDLARLLADLVDITERLALAGFGAALRCVSVEFTEDGERRARKLVLTYFFGRGAFAVSAYDGRAVAEYTMERRAREAVRGVVRVEALIPRQERA